MNNNPHLAAISRIDSLFSNRKLFWNTINSTMHKKMLGFVGMDWHSAVFIPVDIWMDIFNKSLKHNFSRHFYLDLDDEGNLLALLCSLMSVTSWRYSQGCYVVNDYVKAQLFNKNEGSVISAEHIGSLSEWTTYIILDDVFLADKKVHGVFCHKNNYTTSGRTTPPDILIITFNVDQDSPQNNDPMPFVILNIKSNQAIESSILSFGGLQYDLLIKLLAPILSLINLLGDPSTFIESEVTGMQRPHYLDVEKNLNFSELNIPSFKLSAPSNMRMWQVGTNHMTHYKKLLRQNSTAKIMDIHWKRKGDGVELIHAAHID